MAKTAYITYLDYSYSMIFPANNKNQYPVRKTAFAHALRAVIRFQAHYKRSVCAIQCAKICLYQSPTKGLAPVDSRVYLWCVFQCEHCLSSFREMCSPRLESV